MRNRLLYLCRYLPWLALLLVVDAVSALLLWLSEAEAFGALIPLILLGTVLLFSVTALVLSRVEQKRENAFRAFLNNPDLINEENLIRSVWNCPEGKRCRLQQGESFGGGLRGICGSVGARDEDTAVTFDNGTG